MVWLHGAGAVVNWAASRAVQQPQSCKPDCIEASIRAESRWAQVSAWFRGQVMPAQSPLPGKPAWHAAAVRAGVMLAVHFHSLTGAGYLALGPL